MTKFGGNILMPLQIIISHEKVYEEKERKNDLIWLLKAIKEIFSGLDKLGNEQVAYYNALNSSVLMQMRRT